MYLGYAWDTSEVCLRYALDVLEIYKRYAWDISEMYLKYTIIKRGEFTNCHFIISRFLVQEDQGWQGRRILALWENVRLPVEAGRGQVSNYLGEVHEEVWKDGTLLVCYDSRGQKMSPWKPWQKNKPCILRIERVMLILWVKSGEISDSKDFQLSKSCSIFEI